MTGPGLVAASLGSVGGMDFGDEAVAFVAEGNARKADVWVFAPQEREVAVELPVGMSGDVSVAIETGRAVTRTVRDGVVRLRLPLRPGRMRVKPPAALAGKAARDWPGSRPAIGVLEQRRLLVGDFGLFAVLCLRTQGGWLATGVGR